MQLIGHTAGIKVGKSVEADCFDLRYRVSRVGEVQKVSQRVAAIDSKACDAIEAMEE